MSGLAIFKDRVAGVLAVALDGNMLHCAHMAKESAGLNFEKTVQWLPFHEAGLPFGDGDMRHSMRRTRFGSAEKANHDSCGPVPFAPVNMDAMKCPSSTQFDTRIRGPVSMRSLIVFNRWPRAFPWILILPETVY